MNRRKNIALIISIIFLCIALADGLTYGFFTFLRWVVFLSSVYVVYLSVKTKQEVWIFVFGLLAILFNPIAIIHLSRNTWQVLDVLTGLFFLVSIFTLKFPKSIKS